MIALEGYGEKSYEKLWSAINESRNTDFIHYLTAMDIPMVGRTKSRGLCEVFEGNLDRFEKAAAGNYDFSKLEDFGDILNRNIHTWFADEDNLNLWRNLQMEMNFRAVAIKVAEEEPVSSIHFKAVRLLLRGNFRILYVMESIQRYGKLAGNRAARSARVRIT